MAKVKYTTITGSFTDTYMVGDAIPYRFDANFSVTSKDDAPFFDGIQFSQVYVDGTLNYVHSNSTRMTALAMGGQFSTLTLGENFQANFTDELGRDISDILAVDVALTAYCKLKNYSANVGYVSADAGSAVENYGSMDYLEMASSGALVNYAGASIAEVSYYWDSVGAKGSVANEGVIGIFNAYTSGAYARADITFVNHGSIEQGVTLGQGNDTFENSLGGVAPASVAGRGGSDIYKFLGDTGGQVSIIEGSNAGTDAIIVNAAALKSMTAGMMQYAVPNNVENFILIGKPAADIYGNAGNNVIVAGNGSDKIFGLTGDDILTGGLGIDELAGGAGNDTFVFTTGTSGSKVATADTIVDFAAGDLIDMSGWDANLAKRGIQDFRFIGLNAFSGALGELAVSLIGGEVYVVGNTTGSKKADFFIHVDGSNVYLDTGSFVF